MRRVVLRLLSAVLFVAVWAAPAVLAQSAGPGKITVYPNGNWFSSGGSASVSLGFDFRVLENHRVSFAGSYFQSRLSADSVHRPLHVVGGVEKIGADYQTTNIVKGLLGTMRINFTKKSVQPFMGIGGGMVKVSETVQGSNLKWVPGYDKTDPNFGHISNQFNTYYAPGLTYPPVAKFVVSTTAGVNFYLTGTPIVFSPGYTYIAGKDGFRISGPTVGVGAKFK